MCGIAGIISNNPNHPTIQSFPNALDSLSKRGPDATGIVIDGGTILGHKRLSIIDTSTAGNQPMKDVSGRYTIIFNGEFFNFKDYYPELKADGIEFTSHSDTEVLLYLYIKYGKTCLDKVNGFFAFCIYDSLEKSYFIARDRMGIKPLLYTIHDNAVIFASEMKVLLSLGVNRTIDRTSMHLYFQLNYLPGENSILENIKRLLPGHYLAFKLDTIFEFNAIKQYCWYEVPYIENTIITSYKQASDELEKRLEAAVNDRLISDVPLGCFLSGGVDSSIITALAAKHTDKLKTFSIGFSDEPQFDETRYAQEVASHCKTEHQAFHLKSNDLLEALPNVLDYLDEPFADSSALAVFILTKETRKEVTVALSGDGADELFAGYRKHRAEWMFIEQPRLAKVARLISPVLSSQQGSRQSAIGNKLRQIHRFAEGASLSEAERYWRWCSISAWEDVDKLLKGTEEKLISLRVNELTHTINDRDFNSVLLNDCKLVLPYDMLVKVDQMSMANSLEVRVPFLDKRVVEWAFQLPPEMKIDKKQQKKIVKDTFKHLLPKDFFERKKQGFEVPLLNWLRADLSPLLDKYFETNFIEEQGLFNEAEIVRIRKKLYSKHPGDATAKIWALLVFQHWYKNVFAN